MMSDDNSHDMFFQLKDISNEIIEKFKVHNDFIFRATT